MYLKLYLYLILQLVASALAYTVPEPKVELLNPKGVRLGIPHQNGIALVAFHVNIDKTISMNQPGEYSADVTEPTNGRWIFDITRTFVDPGDKINYWLHVQYGNSAYRKIGGVVASGKPIDIDLDAEEPTLTDDSGPSSVSTVDSSTDKTDCERSITTVDRRTVCKGQLIFEDNFDNPKLEQWTREVRLPISEDDAEFVSFQDRSENCYVSKGQLHIVPSLLSELPGFNESTIRSGELDLRSKCTGIIDLEQECKRQAQFSQILPPVVSARIRTKDTFNFRYGKVEIRAKMPKGDWLLPLILLEPTENYYGYSGYESGQMRVAFIRGNEYLEDGDGHEMSGNRISGGVVLSTKETMRDIGLKGSVRRSHLGNDFHKYVLTWTDEVISLEIDDNEYAVIRGDFAQLCKTHNIQHAKRWENREHMSPFDREFFLTLGVSAGGHADFPDNSKYGPERKTKPWRNADPKAELQFWNDRANWRRTWNGLNAGLHIDYIRVYAL